jgi:hypothetical protein
MELPLANDHYRTLQNCSILTRREIFGEIRFEIAPTTMLKRAMTPKTMALAAFAISGFAPPQLPIH